MQKWAALADSAAVTPRTIGIVPLLKLALDELVPATLTLFSLGRHETLLPARALPEGLPFLPLSVSYSFAVRPPRDKDTCSDFGTNPRNPTSLANL